MAGVPDRSGTVEGVGVAPFDELKAAGGRLIDGGSEEYVDVIGHDREAVEEELVLVSVAEECGDEQFGVGSLLEMAMLLECRDGDCVCG